MMAYTHVLFALLFLLLPSRMLDYYLPVEALAAAVFASLLPDLDHPKSMAGRILLPVSLLLNATVGHRTLTHSLAGFSMVTIFAYLITVSLGLPAAAYIAFIVGYASHILADLLNDAGVALMYPFEKRRYSILPRRWGIRTESQGEHAIAAVLAVLVASQLIRTLL